MTHEFTDAFEELSEPIHPGFRNSLRSALEAGQPHPSSNRRLLVAVAVASVVLLGGIPLARFVGGAETGRGGPAVISTPGPVPSPSTSPAASPGPVASLPKFQCEGGSLGFIDSAAPIGPITVRDVRAGSQEGFDRFVIELSALPTEWSVSAQPGATFTQDPSGLPVTLAGTSGILVRLVGTGPANGGWQRVLRVNGPALREIREVGNFEGVYRWALGVHGSGCFRAFWLTGPDRLVVDVQAG